MATPSAKPVAAPPTDGAPGRARFLLIASYTLAAFAWRGCVVICDDTATPSSPDVPVSSCSCLQKTAIYRYMWWIFPCR